MGDVTFSPATIQYRANAASDEVDAATQRVRTAPQGSDARPEACNVSYSAQFERDTLLDQRDLASRDMDRARGVFGDRRAQNDAAMRFARAGDGARQIGVSLRRLNDTLAQRGQAACPTLPPRTPRP